MRQLARRSYFRKKFGVRYIDESWPYLEVDQPLGVTRLIGAAKKELQGRVFLRGQCHHHRLMVPSLFRGKNLRLETLRLAESDLVQQIQTKVRVGRFQQENIAALLQHYGLRTSWLDVVDNLFIAVWFATNNVQQGSGSLLKINQSQEESGWLYLIASEAGSRELQCVDLRIEHNALSSRPHVQHGVSLTINGPVSSDLSDFVVATVRFPIRNFTVSGSLFESSLLFPPKTADHTLKLLLKHRISDIAADVERKHGLSSQTLGRVSEVKA